MSKYTFRRDGNDFIAERTAPAHDDTELILIVEHDNGYGCTAVMNDVTDFPMRAVGQYDFLEYRDGDTGEYYSVVVADLMAELNGGAEAAHRKVDVRHAAWPGMSRREMERELLQRRQRAVQKAVQRERARRARQAREAHFRAEQKALLKEVEAAMESEMGSLQEAIDAAIRDEFGESDE